MHYSIGIFIFLICFPFVVVTLQIFNVAVIKSCEKIMSSGFVTTYMLKQLNYFHPKYDKFEIKRILFNARVKYKNMIHNSLSFYQQVLLTQYTKLCINMVVILITGIGFYLFPIKVKNLPFKRKSKLQLNQNQTSIYLKFKQICPLILKYQKILTFGVQAIIFVIFNINPDTILSTVVPSHWQFLQGNREMHLGLFQYNKAVNLYKSYHELPEGYTWLDQRPNPKFPLIHAPYEVACAYQGQRKEFYAECNQYFKNKESQAGKVMKTQQVFNTNATEEESLHLQLSTTRRPNIVVILLESFQPQPYGINQDVLKSRKRLQKAQMYNESYFPYFAHLANDGLQLSALSSNGNPTAFGWLDFYTGLNPRRRGYNILVDQFNDVDDINSFLTQNDYITRYTSPEQLTFDNKLNWVFRGNTALKSTRAPSIIKNSPRWFDFITFDDPAYRFCKAAGLKCEPRYSFLFPDRLQLFRMAQGFELDIKMSQRRLNMLSSKVQTNNSKLFRQPVYSTILTADTHVPYEGYDGKYFTEKLKNEINNIKYQNFLELLNNFSTHEMKFMIQLHNTEQYVKQTIERIQNADNHTILIVLGDHPAKGIFNDVVQTTFQEKPGDEDIRVDKSCLKALTFNDNLFLTTGFINYLGNEPPWEKLFQDLKGHIIKTPTDHQDIIYTLQKLVAPQIPSARNGRDLFTLFKQLKNNEKLPKHISIRNTQYHLEIATEDQLYRMNLISKTGDQHNGIQPSCVTDQEQRENIPKQKVDDFILIQKLLEHITGRNRVFHYGFRKTNCVKTKSCKFPTNINQPFKEPLIRQCFTVIFCSFGMLIILDKLLKRFQKFVIYQKQRLNGKSKQYTQTKKKK